MKPTPRRCYLCGNTYDRRNLIEGWTALNIKDLKSNRLRGHKEVRKICTKCLDPGVASRFVASPGIVNRTLHSLIPIKLKSTLKAV